MVQGNYTTQPAVFGVAVGRHPEVAGTTFDTIVELADAPGSLLGLIVNESESQNLVFALQQGATNLDGGYATRQIRVDATLVNSVTVGPKQRVTFTVDGPNVLPASRYFRLRVSDQTKAFGHITLVSMSGSIEPRNLFPTP